jgi:festuclavine dehydrogenase
MSSTVLLTGGTGKTATRLAALLQAQNIPVLLTSRQGQSNIPSPFKGVKFDWADPSTYENPFNEDSTIDKVYLVAPPQIDMQPFVEVAMKKGVKRFVLLNSLLSEKGGPAHGKLHAFLAESGVDYCVLRPSTFFGEWFSPRWIRLQSGRVLTFLCRELAQLCPND